MNNHSNAARANNIKADNTETKEVVNLADRLWYVLELKINKLIMAMQESTIRSETDMIVIVIQALEWVQGQIQDLILNNVTRDWPVYNK